MGIIWKIRNQKIIENAFALEFMILMILEKNQSLNLIMEFK